MDFQLTPVPRWRDAELLALQREYYAFDSIPFDEANIRAGLDALFGDRNNGIAWFIEIESVAAGYAILTRCFSVEFRGAFGLLDEFFLREQYRRQGIGSEVLRRVCDHCRENGMAAVRLEVEYHNVSAEALYERAGFVAHERNIMTRWL